MGLEQDDVRVPNLAVGRSDQRERLTMRRIDKFISFLMWVNIAAAFPVATNKNVYNSDWHFTLALCLLWLPPALSPAHMDETPGPQSPWFYRFTILTLLWDVGLVAYGLYFF